MEAVTPVCVHSAHRAVWWWTVRPPGSLTESPRWPPSSSRSFASRPSWVPPCASRTPCGGTFVYANTHTNTDNVDYRWNCSWLDISDITKGDFLPCKNIYLNHRYHQINLLRTRIYTGSAYRRMWRCRHYVIKSDDLALQRWAKTYLPFFNLIKHNLFSCYPLSGPHPHIPAVIMLLLIWGVDKLYCLISYDFPSCHQINKGFCTTVCCQLSQLYLPPVCSITPSSSCGPFRELKTMFQAGKRWVEELEKDNPNLSLLARAHSYLVEHPFFLFVGAGIFLWVLIFVHKVWGQVWLFIQQLAVYLTVLLRCCGNHCWMCCCDSLLSGLSSTSTVRWLMVKGRSSAYYRSRS